MSIGDVTSNARGSGARFNTGKMQADLLPLAVVSQLLQRTDPPMSTQFPELKASAALYGLGQWQRNGELRWLDYTLQALAGSKGMWGLLNEATRVLDYGRKKYAPWNWAKGFAWSVPLACAVRHLQAILEGEELDPESGEPHRAHVACNVLMLLTFIETFPEGDDRPRTLAPLPVPAKD